MPREDGWGDDGAVRCFLSYHTDDSEYWGGLGPTWGKHLKTQLDGKLPGESGALPDVAQVYEYSGPEGHAPGDWRTKLLALVRTCDVFIALVTDRYLDKGHEAIAIELGELMRREEGVAFPIFITERRSSPAWDTEYADWIFRQDGFSHKKLMSYDKDDSWDGSKTPPLPRAVSTTIVRHLDLQRAASRRAAPTSQLPVRPAIADALADIYASVGRRTSVSLPASVAELKIGTRSQEQLWTAAEELAVLLDERASEAVLLAWAKRFLE